MTITFTICTGCSSSFGIHAIYTVLGTRKFLPINDIHIYTYDPWWSVAHHLFGRSCILQKWYVKSIAVVHYLGNVPKGKIIWQHLIEFFVHFRLLSKIFPQRYDEFVCDYLLP